MSPCPVSWRPWFSLTLACGTELLMFFDSMVCDVDRSQCSGLPAMEDCIVHPSMVSMIKLDCLNSRFDTYRRQGQLNPLT